MDLKLSREFTFSERRLRKRQKAKEEMVDPGKM